MTPEKTRPKTIESQFLRLKECEEKICQRILAELDDINILLENTKDKYEPMDENISDAEFTSKIIYLTERQNVESKKSRRFSPAQVYEQAVFEAYFRDEFNMPEIGEIEDGSDGRKINDPFSASDFLFSDKFDTSPRFVSETLEKMVKITVSPVDDREKDSCDEEDVESKRSLSNKKIESKRCLSSEKSESKKHQFSKRTESRRPSLTGKVESKKLSSGSANLKRVYNQNELELSNEKIGAKSPKIGERIESAKPPLTENVESKKLSTIVVHSKRIESTKPLLIEKVDKKQLPSIILLSKTVYNDNDLGSSNQKIGSNSSEISERMESGRPLLIKKIESKKLPSIIVQMNSKKNESAKTLLTEKNEPKKLRSIIIHSKKVFNENCSETGHQKIDTKKPQSSERIESAKLSLKEQVASKNVSRVIVNFERDDVSDSVTGNQKIEKRFKRIFDYATSDGVPTKSIRINSQKASDSKIKNENIDENKNIGQKHRRTSDSDLRDRIKQRATRRVFFNPNFINSDPDRFKAL